MYWRGRVTLHLTGGPIRSEGFNKCTVYSFYCRYKNLQWLNTLRLAFSGKIKNMIHLKVSCFTTALCVITYDVHTSTLTWKTKKTLISKTRLFLALIQKNLNFTIDRKKVKQCLSNNVEFLSRSRCPTSRKWRCRR